MFGIPLFLLIAGFVVIVFIFWMVPIRLWITAWASGAYVPITTLIGMRLRKVSPATIIWPLIAATKAGLRLNIRDLEGHYLAGGNVNNVVKALISADKAAIDLSFQKATAIDLAGRDILEAVHVSVNPKVIQTPKVAAMAKDGIQLIALARVTVRANLPRLVGGAGEETILADSISRTVLEKGLDSGTAYDILSIDIADVDVGKNIGAELQADQAEADKRVAQARAEQRRAMAVAVEQEKRALVEEMRARVVESEAQVPLAIAEAFRSGNLGVMEYARYRNIVSDTSMRESIAEGSRESKQGRGGDRSTE
ncbi:MAG: hypothetical protein AMS25_12970 [Gemmatimonas sp. SM23_52]|nr:MAG: hypothetical protein AMS25_12970 [Gemmatimonas sp. SM23_52]